MEKTPTVRRVLAATDRSASADEAARWAARLAGSNEADLVLVRVLVPADGAEPPAEEMEAAQEDIGCFASELAGQRGRGIVRVGEDPSDAILRAVADEGADVVVLGNVGMSGRKKFLLGNIPNRVSHNARCTVIIVNTSNGARAAPIIESVEESRPSQRLVQRAWHIGRVLVKAGVNEMRSRPTVHDEEAVRQQARRMRSALLDLGPTFAKLGQILSTRPDLLPQSFLDELATLQERVTPLTEAEVVAMLEQELHVPWEDVFESIEPEPLAAGTIAEVHRAVLETGDRVVVKVQRPTAERDILDDLGLLELFAEKAAARPGLRQVIDLPAIVEHLSTSLRRELDFRSEAENLKRMKEMLQHFSRLDVPDVYEELSTSRLLVMQEVQGVPVSQAPAGQARKEAARQLLESYYDQVLEAGFFHADPHPGNMKWWNDKIYLLDLGMVGEVDERVRNLVLMLLFAFSQGDPSFLTEVILMLAGGDRPAEAADPEGFEAAIRQFMDKYRNLPLREIQMGPMLQEITETATRYNVPVPSTLALVAKAFAQMQLAAADLDPDLDPFAVAEAFIVRSTVGRLGRSISPKSLFYEMQKAQMRVSRVLEAFEALIGARPGARLQVQFRGTEALQESITQVGRRLALALGLSGAFLGMAVTVNSERAPRWMPRVMGAIGSAFSTGLLLDVARSQLGQSGRQGQQPSGGSPGATIAHR